MRAQNPTNQIYSSSLLVLKHINYTPLKKYLTLKHLIIKAITTTFAIPVFAGVNKINV